MRRNGRRVMSVARAVGGRLPSPPMTYTIVAKCPDTDALGVGIATYSLGVGGYCPFLARGSAAVSTQAFANPTLGPIALAAIAAGDDPETALAGLRNHDPGFEYRQVCIVDHTGRVGMHTGATTRGWAGHLTGDGFAAFGNVLSGAPVVQAIHTAFAQSAGAPLAERLLQAIEAGRDAGGQASATGEHLPERSAALLVQGADIVDDLNLRVDLHDDAVTELRRVYAGYAPYLPYYALRARRPEATPAQDVWARDNLSQPV